jgi:hypothetical protein
MSAHRSFLQRSVLLATAAGIATVLVGASAAGAASPPEPADRAACATLLAQAATWPGGTLPEPGNRVFSDAYESHLFQQPPCAALPPA